MSIREAALAVVERFRDKYFTEGVADAGILDKAVQQYGNAVIEELEQVAKREQPDACAVLWSHYWWEEQEDTAWEWWDRGLDLESPLMEAIDKDNMEQEIGEDDWADGEFEAYDDETEAGG